jgi:hypothetical protein
MNKKVFANRFDFDFIYPTTHDGVHAIVDRCKLLSKDSSIGNILFNYVENDAYTYDANASVIIANTSQILLKDRDNRKPYEPKDLARF